MPPVLAPLERILHAHGLRRLDLAAIAGVDLKVVHRLCRGEFDGMKIRTLTRVADSLGLSPADLAPVLLIRKTATANATTRGGTTQ
jgi:DNA-binding Xre family transcriptional regulator